MFQKCLFLLLLPFLWVACTDQEKVFDPIPEPPAQPTHPAWVDDYRLLFTPDGKYAKITPEQIEKEVMGKKWKEIEHYAPMFSTQPEDRYRLKRLGIAIGDIPLQNQAPPFIIGFAPDSVMEKHSKDTQRTIFVDRHPAYPIFSYPAKNAPETPSNLLDFVDNYSIERDHWVLLSLEDNELILMRYEGRWHTRSIIYKIFSRCVLLPD